jgi:hypothetical protein
MAMADREPKAAIPGLARRSRAVQDEGRNRDPVSEVLSSEGKIAKRRYKRGRIIHEVNGLSD